jgi:hypothetical protein
MSTTTHSVTTSIPQNKKKESDVNKKSTKHLTNPWTIVAGVFIFISAAFAIALAVYVILETADDEANNNNNANVINPVTSYKVSSVVDVSSVMMVVVEFDAPPKTSVQQKFSFTVTCNDVTTVISESNGGASGSSFDYLVKFNEVSPPVAVHICVTDPSTTSPSRRVCIGPLIPTVSSNRKYDVCSVSSDCGDVNLVCNTLTQTCLPRQPSQGPCSEAQDCVSALICVSSKCVKPTADMQKSGTVTITSPPVFGSMSATVLDVVFPGAPFVYTPTQMSTSVHSPTAFDSTSMLVNVSNINKSEFKLSLNRDRAYESTITDLTPNSGNGTNITTSRLQCVKLKGGVNGIGLFKRKEVQWCVQIDPYGHRFSEVVNPVASVDLDVDQRSVWSSDPQGFPILLWCREDNRIMWSMAADATGLGTWTVPIQAVTASDDKVVSFMSSSTSASVTVVVYCVFVAPNARLFALTRGISGSWVQEAIVAVSVANEYVNPFVFYVPSNDTFVLVVSDIRNGNVHVFTRSSLGVWSPPVVVTGFGTAVISCVMDVNEKLSMLASSVSSSLLFVSMDGGSTWSSGAALPLTRSSNFVWLHVDAFLISPDILCYHEEGPANQSTSSGYLIMSSMTQVILETSEYQTRSSTVLSRQSDTYVTSATMRHIGDSDHEWSGVSTRMIGYVSGMSVQWQAKVI